MVKFLPYEGNIPFQGRGRLFTRGIQQSLLKRSQIRISIMNMGWDAAYTRLVSMPPTVRTGLKGALKENAELIENLAKYYVRIFWKRITYRKALRLFLLAGLTVWLTRLWRILRIPILLRWMYTLPMVLAIKRALT